MLVQHVIHAGVDPMTHGKFMASPPRYQFRDLTAHAPPLFAAIVFNTVEWHKAPQYIPLSLTTGSGRCACISTSINSFKGIFVGIAGDDNGSLGRASGREKGC